MNFTTQTHRDSTEYPENRSHGYHGNIKAGSGHVGGDAADKGHKQGRITPIFEALIQCRAFKGQVAESRGDAAAHSNVQIFVVGPVYDQMVTRYLYNIIFKILAHDLSQGFNAKAGQGTQLDKLQGF